MDTRTGTLDGEHEREPAEVRTRIRLCGQLEVELEGRGVAGDLRGRQARLVVAYLVTRRQRPVARSELITLLWPDRAPKDPQGDLRPVLSGVRRALGPGVLQGREHLRLDLPEPAWVDTELAAAAVENARVAAGRNDWRAAREHALTALELLQSSFLSGDEAEWLDSRRRELEELQLESLEWTARGALAAGGTENGAAQRAARELIARAPFRETGHRLLMELLAAGGDVAEALRVYDRLRVRLRDELGTAPAPELQALHQRLLRGELETPADRPPQAPMPASLRRSASRGTFVGREAHLERLEELWEATVQGRPEPVLLAGEPGIGKTRLAAEFAAVIHARGATVLYGHCDEDALGRYQPFVEALGEWVSATAPEVLSARAGALAPELAALVPELARRLRDVRAPQRADPELERYRLLDAVRELVGMIAGAAPLLLVLDDLHWADQGTLRMLRYLLRAPGSMPVMILATYREAEPGPAHALATMLDDLRREQRHARLRLDGLDEREAAALVESRAGQPPAGELLRAIHEETSGNPFFIEAVVQDLTERDRLRSDAEPFVPALAVDEIGIPEGVKEVIRRRLAHLGDGAVRALRIASVVGRDFELRVLEQVAGETGDELAEVLEDAVTARLVEELAGEPGRFRFYHALVRAALYDDLTAARRARLHRRVGEALERDDRGNDRLSALAHHFYEATRGGEPPEKAIDYSRRAGDSAMRELAYEQAAEQYERALRALVRTELPNGRLRLDLLLALGEARASAGASLEARSSFKAAADLGRELGEHELVGRAALGFGRIWWQFILRGSTDEELIALLEDALARLPAAPSPLRAQLLARLASELYYTRGGDRIVSLVEDAVQVARASGDTRALAQALNAKSQCMASGGYGVVAAPERLALAAEALSLSRRCGDNETVLTAHEGRVAAFVDVGDFEAVDREIVSVNRLASDTRVRQYLWYARTWSAMRALMQGRFDDAERLAHEALAIGQESIGDAAIVSCSSQVSVVRGLRGNYHDDAIEQIIETYVPHESVARAAVAMLWAMSGREEEAHAELGRAARLFLSVRYDRNRVCAGFRLAYTCYLLDDAELARDVYRDLLPHAGGWARGAMTSAWCDGPVRLPLGWLASTMSCWAEAEEHFEAALRECARVGARPALAWAQADYAQTLLRRARAGDRERSIDLLDRALDAAQDLGMAGVERAASDLRAQV